MIIKPRTRGFICTTAHPVGCARQVQEQIEYVKSQPAIKGPRNVLVIGASTGYGLSARVVAAFGAGANTIGVYRDGSSVKGRTASAGWYNSAAFEQAAEEAGLKSYSVIGDAFTNELKANTVAAIRQQFGKVDMVIYSVAAPRRTDPNTGETYTSTLKPIGETYTNKTVNFHTGEVSDISIEPATPEEIEATVRVMGGDDWKAWIDALSAGDVLTDDVVTVAFSYIGSTITQAIYRQGSIGQAKDHLEATAREMNEQLSAKGGHAYVAVCKALVTQSSSAIPVVPLYMSALYKVMKAKDIHEGCIEQMYRMFADRLYNGGDTPVDEKDRLRLDDWEMRDDVQAEVATIWNQLSTENVYELTDLEGYRQEFFQLFGFETDGVDYEADVDPDVKMLHTS
ncbi:enoyl-ACP reductase FabV [Paenibacillus campi]|uniref:enoyl-ACP reductase FabV n=1 Tax=Paenibacillus campi TaxID=3106031 RepID=UPI002AFF5E52|nr:enoyl-ACP reductase FabV [Paenibacillus sp. SGZ-1014]